MSGHSKWATTKHKKAVIDAKRGKLFAKLIKNIEVAARTGGGDPDGNPTLYDAIQKARKNSVPIDNIDRAVKRGSGAEAGGADWQTIMYEGYGPNGVAVLIECLTDNRNRAAIGGAHRDDPQRRLDGRPGLGVLPVQPQGRRDRARRTGRDRGRRADGGARRRRRGGQRPRRGVRGGLRADRPGRRCAPRCRTPASTTTRPTSSFLPSVQVPLDEDGARKVLRAGRRARGLDDVQNVYANFDVSDEVLEAVEG